MATDGTIVPGRDGRRAVTAFFDDRAAAQAAVDDLVAANVARDRITLVEGGADPLAREPKPSRDRSIWDDVKALFLADADRHAYGEGLRRGGFLLSVATGPDDYDRVIALLDREGAVDMDAREADWALEGWDPARAAAEFRSGAPVGAGTPAGQAGTAAPAPAAADPPAMAPSVLPIGPTPAEGALSAAPSEGGRTIIRDPGPEGSRLRTYVDAHVRQHPEGGAD